MIICPLIIYLLPIIDYLYKMIKLILVILGLVGIASSNGLLITGRAKQTLSSSVAVLKFEIVGSDKLPSKSIAKAEAMIEKMKKGLKGLVDKESIKVTPPQIELESANEGKVAFYETIIEIEVMTTRSIGEVIEAAEKFGTLIDVTYKASEVIGLGFRLSGMR